MNTSRGIIFDLDGTLLDSAEDLRGALNRMLAETGRLPIPASEIAFMVGDGALKLVERGLAAGGAPLPAPEVIADLTRQMLAYYDQIDGATTRPYPGVPETLAALAAAGYALAVCTNKPQAPAEALLAKTGLSRWLPIVIGGDTVIDHQGNPLRKPDGRHVLAALKALGVAPEAAVMVGDSPNDMDAGRNAGLGQVIAVGYGYCGATRVAPEDMGADHVVQTFAEILPLLVAPA
ncbi:MAG: HAD family hydrolase [Magnetospiraceae bacterium]